jgi:uncharacterized protein (DUF58 family)
VSILATSRRRPIGPPSADPVAVATRAAFLRRLDMDISRRLDGMLSGDHLAFATGPGTEPAGARSYGPGDDARRIDWSLTARALQPHIRTTQADREIETCVIVDRSASLDFGTALREKREVALAAAGAFGFLTVRDGNRFGVVIGGGENLTRPPIRSGRAGLLATLAAIYDTPRHDAAPGPNADLAAAMVQVERTQRRRGQVIVVSDFLDSTDWVMPLRRLGLRHLVIGVHVTDPRELDLPAVGMLEVIDTETGRRLSVHTGSASLRTRYRAAAGERQERIRRSILEAGAGYLHLSTDRDWLLDVVQHVKGRHNRAAATFRRFGAHSLAGSRS